MKKILILLVFTLAMQPAQAAHYLDNIGCAGMWAGAATVAGGAAGHMYARWLKGKLSAARYSELRKYSNHLLGIGGSAAVMGLLMRHFSPTDTGKGQQVNIDQSIESENDFAVHQKLSEIRACKNNYSRRNWLDLDRVPVDSLNTAREWLDVFDDVIEREAFVGFDTLKKIGITYPEFADKCLTNMLRAKKYDPLGMYKAIADFAKDVSDKQVKERCFKLLESSKYYLPLKEVEALILDKNDQLFGMKVFRMFLKKGHSDSDEYASSLANIAIQTDNEIFAQQAITTIAHLPEWRRRSGGERWNSTEYLEKIALEADTPIAKQGIDALIDEMGVIDRVQSPATQNICRLVSIRRPKLAYHCMDALLRAISKPNIFHYPAKPTSIQQLYVKMWFAEALLEIAQRRKNLLDYRLLHKIAELQTLIPSEFKELSDKLEEVIKVSRFEKPKVTTPMIY